VVTIYSANGYVISNVNILNHIHKRRVTALWQII